VPVPDRRVSLFEERMEGKIVGFHVVVDVLRGPVENRMDLVQTVPPLDAVEGPAMISLSGAKAGKPGPSVEFLQGPPHGLHFSDFVVKVQFLDIPPRPEPSVKSLHAGRADLRLIHPQVQFQPIREEFRVTIGLGGKVAGVDPDHGYVRFHYSRQMERDGGLDAETGTHHEAVSKDGFRPFDDLDRARLDRRIQSRSGNRPHSDCHCRLNR
jgi:hypothetical protein